MNIPDYVSPAIGHRAWQWDLTGLMSLNGERWHPGHAMTARCKKASDRHQSPQKWCSCGIYSARSLDQLREIGCATFAISGDVYLWGTVVEHELGWRAQFAYPKSLAVRFEMIPVDPKEAESHLDTLVAYGVDIFIDDVKKHIPLWKKGSGYESAGLEYVRKPAVDKNLKEWLLGQLHERVDFQKLNRTDRGTALDEVLVLIQSLLSSEVVPRSFRVQETLIRAIMAEIFGFGPLEPLLEDPSVSDILVNRFDRVHIVRAGKLELTGLSFRENKYLMQIIDRILSRVGRHVDESSPMVSCRLFDGTQVNAIIPPLAMEGPCLFIRRPQQRLPR